MKKVYQILDDLVVKVEVLNNPYNFQLEQLFKMAARINKKRSFLFISRVLGKHLALNPKIPLLLGNLLALRYLEVVHGIKDERAKKIAQALQRNEDIDGVWNDFVQNPLLLPKSTTIIGFAETATALGHAVFSSFQQNTKYIHTTREQINELTSVINFEEEHSHATSHRVYAIDPHFFEDDSEIVLVDDEITTGKTTLNIIRQITKTFPLKKQFTVISILDWRTPEYRHQFSMLEEELNIKISTVSLIDGIVTTEGTPNLIAEQNTIETHFSPTVTYIPVHHLLTEEMLQISSINANGTKNLSNYLIGTGRFGLSPEKNRQFLERLQDVAEYVKKYRKGQKTLIIGTGEFMYIPMEIAARLGENVFFHSTTRSPIYKTDKEHYIIQQKFVFDSPENEGVQNYLYNIDTNQYDEIFIIIERMTSKDSITTLINELSKTKIPFINIVNMTEIV